MPEAVPRLELLDTNTFLPERSRTSNLTPRKGLPKLSITVKCHGQRIDGMPTKCFTCR